MKSFHHKETKRLDLIKKENLKGEEMHEAAGGGYEVRIPLPKANYEQGLIAINF